MIELSWRERVSVLTMRHGKVNALDVELCRALVGAVDSAVDAGAQAVVVSGSGGAFSAGVDLRRVIAGGEAYVADLLPALQGVFDRLARLELPVVAAVNGHAIAGGFVLLAAADRALMADGPGRLGVTELLVGVPISSMGMALVGRRAGEVLWRRLVLEGSTFSAGEAVAGGLVDELVAPEDLLQRSVEAAARLASLGPAFVITKRQLRAELEARIQRLAEFDPEVEAVWRDPRTLERIRSYMDSLRR